MTNDKVVDLGLCHWARDAWRCPGCGNDCLTFEDAETCCEPYRTTVYQCGCGEVYSVNAPKSFREHILACNTPLVERTGN